MFADRIYVDLQNLDDENRVRLNTTGTVRDLNGRKPSVGDLLLVYTDDENDAGVADPLLATGRVELGSDGTPSLCVEWTTVRNASAELYMLKKRFFDTAIGDMLRALDGGSLLGATTLGLCVLDHLAYLSTGRGEADDFKSLITNYLVRLNAGYDPTWLWDVRNGLVHVHGMSKKLVSGDQPLGVTFTHLQPDRHLTRADRRKWLNVDSFIAHVITVAWEVFDSFRAAPETPLRMYHRLLVIWHSDKAADKPFADMHRTLRVLDDSPPRLAELDDEIKRALQPQAAA